MYKFAEVKTAGNNLRIRGKDKLWYMNATEYCVSVRSMLYKVTWILKTYYFIEVKSKIRFIAQYKFYKIENI